MSRIKCATAFTMANLKDEGAIVDEVALDKHLKAPISKVKYGVENHAHHARLADEARPKLDTYAQKGLNLLESYELPIRGIAETFTGSKSVLDESIAKRVNDLYMDHISRHGSEAGNIWQAEYAPQIRALRDEVMPNYHGTRKADYADKFFDLHERGGRLYNNPKKGHIQKAIGNVVGNLVMQNPAIMAGNMFEATPKMLAYATEAGNPGAVFKAIGKYMSETGGQFWKRIPELEAKGVYGFKQPGGFSIIDITENPFRGMTYYLGEMLSPGGGLKAIEDIAFDYRLGYEPMFMLDHNERSTVTLMRFTVGTTQFLGHLYHQTLKGNPKAALALGAFMAMQTAQTGSVSALPVPVTALGDSLTEGEFTEGLRGFDEMSGANLTQRFLGTDLSELTQPIGGIAFQVGGSVATSDIKAGMKGLSRSAGSAAEGDVGLAAAYALEAALKLGQFGKFPGVNNATARFGGAIRKSVENDLSAKETLIQYGKDTRLINEPE